ncbi:hypothetical protein AB0I53_49275 [Saccharopolyspora sp. NPDC050389]|uniref:effector-associated constant component EACC1 n=1 Tax=Saccharopolyspora sp. NPDC050389 TaxID=3155516 RepID=UPI0033DD408C
MHARVRVTAGREQQAELRSLGEWLRQEDDLRGYVSLEQPTPAPGEMGALSEVLVVALSTGGAVTALARSVSVWLQQRHSDVTIEVSNSDRTVTLDARRVVDAEALVREVLKQQDGKPEGS